MARTGSATLDSPSRRGRQSASTGALRALGAREAWLLEQGRTSRAARAQTIRDLEDAGREEDATKRDYAGRYPIELLQNAHDAAADAGAAGAVVFHVRRGALLVANRGRPFDARRITSLVRQRSSEKAERSRRRTIGYKGIGFSAVFEVSRSPQVITASGLAFGFDRARARDLVEERLRQRPKTVAARNFPFLLEPDAWSEDAELIRDLLSDGFVTVVRLPFVALLRVKWVVERLVEERTPLRA